MKLDPRLAALAALVEKGCPVADIGSDHAYLPCYLVSNGISPLAIASDIADGPCASARRTVEALGLGAKIEVRQGDGLAVLREQPGLENFYLVLAGLGGTTICTILEAELELAKKARGLILQPMAGASLLRTYLGSRGFRLLQEDLVQSGEHLYEIIKAGPGPGGRYSPGQLLIGPLLLAGRHPLLGVQISKQRAALARNLAAMAASSQAVNSPKYQYFLRLAKEVEEIADAWHSNHS